MLKFLFWPINVIRVILLKSSRFQVKSFVKQNKISDSKILEKFHIEKLQGRGNIIDIKSRHISNNVHLYISGSNNLVFIDEDVSFLEGSIYIEDDNNELHIGKGTMIYKAELAVAEGCLLSIGERCLLSKEIRICTTDSHSIVNINTGERVNYASNICIGNHVWIGFRTSINKGVFIGEGSVVGGNSVVTKDIPEHTCAVGIPAKVVKTGIDWEHERVNKN